jgi:hypothetical protein
VMTKDRHRRGGAFTGDEESIGETIIVFVAAKSRVPNHVVTYSK